MREIHLQKKRYSFLESCISTCFGFIVALCIQLMVFPLYGIYVDLHINVEITLIFTMVSVIRGYIIRRVFNYLHFKKVLA